MSGTKMIITKMGTKKWEAHKRTMSKEELEKAYKEDLQALRARVEARNHFGKVVLGVSPDEIEKFNFSDPLFVVEINNIDNEITVIPAAKSSPDWERWIGGQDKQSEGYLKEHYKESE